MCIDILPASVSVYQVHTWCPQKPVGARSPELELQFHVGAGNQTWKNDSTLNHWIIYIQPFLICL